MFFTLFLFAFLLKIFLIHVWCPSCCNTIPLLQGGDINKYMLYNNSLYVKQSGAVEACWAHNPEVRGSKPRSAIFLFFFFFFAKIVWG